MERRASSTLLDMMQAHSDRDAIRNALIHELRQVAGLPSEIAALLIADQRATEALRNTVAQHLQSSEPTTNNQEAA